jgi:hypothetical protein
MLLQMCLAIYMGTESIGRSLQGIPSEAPDVRSSVLGGAVAFGTMALPLGLRSASVGLFEGALLGGVIGLSQTAISGLLEAVALDSNTDDTSSSAQHEKSGSSAIVPTSVAESTRAGELASSLDKISKRMAAVLPEK